MSNNKKLKTYEMYYKGDLYNVILAYGRYVDTNNLALIVVDCDTNKKIDIITINFLETKIKSNQAFIDTYNPYLRDLEDFIINNKLGKKCNIKAKNKYVLDYVDANEYPLFSFDLSKMWNLENEKCYLKGSDENGK